MIEIKILENLIEIHYYGYLITWKRTSNGFTCSKENIPDNIYDELSDILDVFPLCDAADFIKAKNLNILEDEQAIERIYSTEN